MKVPIEGQVAPEAGKTYPICAAGDGACPPEDRVDPDAFVTHRDDILSLDSRDYLATMAEIIGDITQERRLEIWVASGTLLPAPSLQRRKRSSSPTSTLSRSDRSFTPCRPNNALD